MRKGQLITYSLESSQALYVNQIISYKSTLGEHTESGFAQSLYVC